MSRNKSPVPLKKYEYHDIKCENENLKICQFLLPYLQLYLL